MSPEDVTFCTDFIEKWKRVATGRIAGALIKAKYGKLSAVARRIALTNLILEAKELSDKSIEIKQRIIDEATKLIDELFDSNGKKP